jgi:hypothetical protein
VPRDNHHQIRASAAVGHGIAQPMCGGKLLAVCEAGAGEEEKKKMTRSVFFNSEVLTHCRNATPRLHQHVMLVAASGTSGR